MEGSKQSMQKQPNGAAQSVHEQPKELVYTTHELAKLAGVSSRTLRYYDQIGLLVPTRAQNDYRLYCEADVKKLESILLLRSCGMPLKSIAEALNKAHFDLASVLEEHLDLLCRQREELDKTIATAKRTVAGLEEFENMDDTEKFEQIKKQLVDANDNEFGEEARELYGDEVIDEANERLLEMDKPTWDAKEELEQRVKDALIAAMATSDPTSLEAKQLAKLHAQWIKIYWEEAAYTPSAHANLADSYLADKRFIAYYDGPCGEGATKFLRDSIKANVE